jgi:hypothetical protein
LRSLGTSPPERKAVSTCEAWTKARMVRVFPCEPPAQI